MISDSKILRRNALSIVVSCISLCVLNLVLIRLVKREQNNHVTCVYHRLSALEIKRGADEHVSVMIFPQSHQVLAP
jgi:hypothetical protein